MEELTRSSLPPARAVPRLPAKHLQRNSEDVAVPSASARLRCRRRFVLFLYPLVTLFFPVRVPFEALTLYIVIKLSAY
jgi:hypothetical protein